MTAGGLRFGYGTNGFADHRLSDALSVLAGLGYDGVALTLDHQHLDPYAPRLAPRVRRVGRDLRRAGLAVVVETGARYLLDPLRKHRPTLLSAEPEGRAARLELLRRAIRVGAELEAEAVHFWSGTPDPGTTREQAWQRLEEGCAEALAEAERAGVDLAFEPEPGMLVEDLAGYRRLLRALGGHERFRLTLDIGHCRCLEPWPETRCVELAADRLAHVQIEDMRRGVHEHLPFGEGEIDFPPILEALRAAHYKGLVSVELPRHSHAAAPTARQSIEFLHHTATTRPQPTRGTPAPADGAPAPQGPLAPHHGSRTPHPLPAPTDGASAPQGRPARDGESRTLHPLSALADGASAPQGRPARDGESRTLHPLSAPAGGAPAPQGPLAPDHESRSPHSLSAPADGESAPQGPPAPDNESRTGGAGGNTDPAEGRMPAHTPPALAPKEVAPI